MKLIGKGVAAAAVLFALCAMAAQTSWDFLSPERARLLPPKVSAGAATASGTRVNGSQPLIPARTITLVGEVADLATPTASLSVSVSLRGASQQARVNGHSFSFDLLVPSISNDDDMVTVMALSGRAYYVSILGSPQRLLALAGADRRLDVSELAGLQVSPYTSAMAWMASRNISSGRIRSDADFESAMRATDSKDIRYGAYLISAVTHGMHALPSGITNGYALLQSRQYFIDVMADPAFLQAGEDYLANQPSPSPLSSLQELPDQLVLTNALPLREAPMSSDAVFLLQRQSADTFDFFEQDSLSNPRYSAALGARGEVRLQPTGTVERRYRDASDELRTRRYLGYTLHRLYRGANQSYWSLALEYEDWANGSSLGKGWIYHALTSQNLAAWKQPNGWGEITAQRSLPWLCVDAELALVKDCEYARYRPSASGTGILVDFGDKVLANLTPRPYSDTGPAFGLWTLDAQGGLRVVNADTDTTFWRVDRPGAGMGTVVYVSRSLSGVALAQAKAGISFTVVDMPATDLKFVSTGSWSDGGSEIRLPAQHEPFWMVNFLRQANGWTGWQLSRSSSTHPGGFWNLMWQREGNGAIVDRYQTDGVTGYECQYMFTNPDAECLLPAYYFRPLSRSGSQFYGVEEIYERRERADGSYSFRRVVSRPTFQRCNDGECWNAIPLSTARVSAAGGKLPLLGRAASGVRPVGRSTAQYSRLIQRHRLGH